MNNNYSGLEIFRDFMGQFLEEDRNVNLRHKKLPMFNTLPKLGISHCPNIGLLYTIIETQENQTKERKRPNKKIP